MSQNPTPPPDWLIRELRDGLQKLLCLSLEGQPSADVIAGTLLAWSETITHGRRFDQGRDELRFREAFRVLANRHRRWPAPVDFLDALPGLPGAPRVARLESDENKRRGMQALTEIAARMGWTGDDDDAAA